jgi:uncharacterized alkaline shock family protein YloU
MKKIIISENALAKLAALTTMQCYGVVGLVPENIGKRFLSLLVGDKLSRGVDVKIKGRQVSFTIYVVLQSGVKVSEVANIIVHQVSYKLEKLTGLKDIDVSVVIKGVKREA